MEFLDPDLLRAKLGDAIESGTDPVRLLAAALAPPIAGEPKAIEELRERLDARPSARSALMRSFAAAGMSSPEDYRAVHPPRVQQLLAAPPSDDLEPRAACSNPHLRVRVAQLDVIEEDDDLANDVVYCLFTTETTNGGEIRVTPPTSPLDEGDNAYYPLVDGVLWGQDGQLRPAGGNMLISYNCFESDTDNGFAQLLEVLGDAAESLGGVAGTNGWILLGAGQIAEILAMALALDNDDHLLKAQHSISPALQIEASNGVYWLVDRSGVNLNSDWHWVLRMEAWGCAEG